MSIIQGTSKSSGAAYTIDQSLRLDGTGDMSRTVSSDGNLRTWTFAFWLKRSGLGTNGGVGFNVGGTYVSGDNRSIFRFHSTLSGGDDDWYWAERSGAAWREDQATTSMHRDPAAWAHYMCVWDTDGGTTPRARRYINGVLVSDLKSGGTAVAANVDSGTNRAGTFQLFDQPGFAGREFEGYAADMYFLDGVAATPSDFGIFSSSTGQFVPIAYSGSFGSNGFYLDFADSSDLGKDVSGNSNHFTTSSLTSSAQVTDTPTNNFAVWNPLIPLTSGNFSDGNLEFTVPGSTTSQHAKSTISFTSGEKKVCEMQTVSGASITLGICDEDFVADNNGFTGDSRGYFDTNGNKIDKDGNGSSYGASFGTSNVIRIEVDLSSNPGTIEFFKDGVSQGDAFTDLDSTKTWFFWSRCKVDAVKANFGQLGFAGTPTTGFTALNTSNISDPTIADPSDYFNTVLYTGNGSTGQSITGVGFQPDWVWTKIRSPNAYSHQLFDAVRGAGKNLQSNNTNAEGDLTSEFISFDSDGFTIDDVNQNVNESGSYYASWNWKASGAGSSNTTGSINTTATSANTTAGFSISTFTGNQTSGATFGHGLGVAPKMVIVKERSPAGNNWKVGHDAMGWGKYIALDTNAAQVTDSAHWNDTAPSSTVVTLGNDTGINQNTATYVAYCFAEVAGYSSIGGYEGNGSTDGPFIYTGFKPAWIMLKRYDSGGEWEVSDRVRDPDNPIRLILQPNSNAVEWDATTRDIDWLSNGFKHRSSHADFNASGGDYLYIAFAETPFKTSTAR